MTIPDIETPRLILRHLSSAVLHASLRADSAAVRALLGTTPPAAWLAEFELMALRLDDLADNPAYAPWSVRAILRREDMAMLGHINFHTVPGHPYLQGHGDVELGYTVYPDYRRQGYAREALLAMADWAVAQGGVQRLVLSIEPGNLPSQALAAQLGFAKVAEVCDADACEEVLVARWPLGGTKR